MKIKPYPFQLEALRRTEEFGGRILIADDMGLGKTTSSLLFVHKHPELRPVVIVCPASLKYQWQRECLQHFGIKATVLEGTSPKKVRKNKKGVYIVNYDILFPRGNKLGWEQFLIDLGPEIFIGDEIHMIGNRGSKRTKSVQRICRSGVPHVIFLSGTPATNRPFELWPALNIIRRDLFPNAHAFGHKFCAARHGIFGWEFKGASNTRELHKLLTENVMIRRRKEEVLDQLPPKQRTVVPLKLSNRREYDHAVKDFLGWLEEYDPERLPRAARAERVVQLGYLKRLAARLKLPMAMEWIDGFLHESDEKLIVFGVHKSIITSLQERYKKQCVVVDGSVTGLDRQQAVDRFLNNKTTRLFIGNIKAAGVGWSGKNVGTVAFVELEWAPGVMTQAEDRIRGIGRGIVGQPVQAVYLIGMDTIEENLLRVIQSKQTALSSVLDGGEQEDDFNVFDLISREMQGK